MANTYTQLHIHFVFAVKYRRSMIEESWKTSYTNILQELFKITGIKC